LERQLAGNPLLQKAVCRAEPLQGRLPFGVVAENAHIHASVAQVGAGLDSGHSDESNAGILEIRRDDIAEDGAHRFVDAPHSAARHPIPPEQQTTETLDTMTTDVSVIPAGPRWNGR